MSKEEIDRQAREHVEDRVKSSKEIGRPMAWYEVWSTALTQPNLDAYEALRLNPYALPSRTYLWLTSAGLVAGLIGALSFGLNPQVPQLLTEIERSGQIAGLSQMLGAFLFCLVPLTGVMNLVNTAISVGVMHLISIAFGGNGKYSEFLYLVAAFSAPLTIATTITGSIPFVNLCLSLPLVFYRILLNMQAIKSAHGLDTFRALGVLFSLFLLNLIIYGLIGWLVYSSIAPYLPTQAF
ncbi:MAG: YIP1 family protein [Anaerolineaceae bacterium]|nr:MAG: YIP1 family protein [Anaerolineaceae bacterium]